MKKISVSQWIIWLLIFLLFISVVLNCVQYSNKTSDTSSLRGSYQTDSPNINGLYLTFDAYGHFCLYNQKDGLLDEGNYIQQENNVYILQSVSGEYSNIILAEKSLYHTSSNGTCTFYSKFDNIPVFVGQWINSWKKWPEGPYEIEPLQ